MKRSFTVGLLFSLLLPALAWAISLDEAKSKGLVGEEPSGYLGVVQSGAPGDVTSLVASVNSQRRDKYSEIAKKNGTPLAAVEALAGEKAIQNTEWGKFYSPSKRKLEKEVKGSNDPHDNRHEAPPAVRPLALRTH